MVMDSRFADSIPAEDDGFLTAIKIRSTTSFGGKVKPSAPCRKILRLAEYERIASLAKFAVISHQLSPASLPGVSAGYCQRALVDESGNSDWEHTIYQ
jgi:hypothetical protein